MKISASIYSNTSLPLLDVVAELERCEVDYLHVDCNDDPAVFEDIATIRTQTQTPIDLHIISSTPEQYLSLIESQQVELVTYQYENLTHAAQLPQQTTYQQGLAITSQTDIQVFDAFQDKCDFVLFMATIPGKSGGSFQRENFQRIRAFRQRYPGVRIHVDGGVNAEVSFILRNMGVASVVSGSYLLNGISIGASMLKLRTAQTHSQFQVGDMMIGVAESPIIQEAGLSFLHILDKIETYGYGLCMVVDHEGKLTGIVTNADVRRGLLKHREDLNNVKLSDILNPNPVVAQEQQSISDLLQMIQKVPFPVNYLPVLNQQKQVVGTLTFFDLVKGES